MAIVKRDSGCKVGWTTYDNLAEAEAAAEVAAQHAARMIVEGYDFGYQWPGTIDDNGDGTYTVTTP